MRGSDAAHSSQIVAETPMTNHTRRAVARRRSGTIKHPGTTCRRLRDDATDTENVLKELWPEDIGWRTIGYAFALLHHNNAIGEGGGKVEIVGDGYDQHASIS